MLPSSQIKEVTLIDYLNIIKKRIWIVFLVFFSFTITQTINTYSKIPIYQATVKILIEKETPKISPFPEVYRLEWPDREYFQTQIRLIYSRMFAKRVFEDLGLDKDPKYANLSDPVGVFLGGFVASHEVGTRIIHVGYKGKDPIEVAKFANAIGRNLIQYDIELKTKAATQALSWLETQLIEVKKKLEDSEMALNNFIQEYKIVNVPELEERAEGLIDSLKSKQAELEREIVEASKRYKEKHPKMIRLNSELEQVKEKIEEETKNFLSLQAKTVEYNVLKREVESNRSLYEALLKRAKETDVAEKLETTNLRIIDFAQIPRVPISPNRRRDISVAGFLSICLGIGLVFFLEYLDSTLKTSEEIELYINLPFLGYAPSAKKEAKSEIETDLLSYHKPLSTITEAYRQIRTSIIFASPEDRPLKTLLITSSIPKEGKTLIAVNLATVFSQTNEKVVIIDADMRKPRLYKTFKIENRKGLSSFLAGTSPLEETIRSTFIPNLSIITSGPLPPNPAELLTSKKLFNLLEELKSKFNRIILDSPPVLAVADTAILANITDGTILVIRAGFTNYKNILSAKQKLLDSKAKIIGTILNRVEIKKKEYYYYYYAEEKDRGRDVR
jgi:capsular exopolysaccharide synthesis family protein